MATSKLVGRKITRGTAHYRSWSHEQWRTTTLEKNCAASSSQIVIIAGGKICVHRLPEIVVCYTYPRSA